MEKENKSNTHFAPSKELQWLFFDLNSYFASVEQQENPKLRGKPIAITPLPSDSTCAIAASYEAKAYGIKTGTRIYEAKKMCPNLICVPARHDRYVDYHHRILTEVDRHIPVTKICSIDEGACLLAPKERSESQAIQIAKNIKEGIKKNIGESIRLSIGIAPNMFLAKTATDLQKPDGLVILRPENYTERLFTLRLKDLCGVGGNIERRLNRAGIFTVKQLWNIAPKHARMIWGSVAGEKFWYMLHGYNIPDQETSKSTIGHSRILAPECRQQAGAHTIARQLSIKACTRLRRYDLFCRQFSLSVRTTNHTRWGAYKTFPPAQDNFTILKMLEELWGEMARHTHTAPLLKVSICLSDFYENHDITNDLFQQKSIKKQPKNDALSHAIDAINRHYGTNTVRIGSDNHSKEEYLGTKIAFSRVPEQAEFFE